MLFQGGALFDSLPVWENVAFRLINADGVGRREAKDRAVEALGLVKLAPMWPTAIHPNFRAACRSAPALPAPLSAAQPAVLRRTDHRAGPDHGGGDQRLIRRR
jgi:ABC-type uncharacterized transport system YnjBCD ATPase subunit